jgi:hypothetical protein
MPAQRPLIEKVLDIVMYAPVGLATQLRTDPTQLVVDVPRMVAEGRTQLEQRVKVAHWVGEMTVQFGRKALDQRLHPPVPVVAPPQGTEADTGAAAPPSEALPAVERHAPFEGYDHLAAAQIVQLLGRLPHVELRMVREYEASGRHRRTILAKIDQLLAT